MKKTEQSSSQPNPQLERARTREAEVSTALGFASALLPDAAAIGLSAVQMVHPAFSLVGIGLRTLNSRTRQAPEVTLSRMDKLILSGEDVFLGDKAMRKRLDRWEERQYRRLNREDGSSNRRLAINKFMLRVGYPLETIIPAAYAYLSKVPHAASENIIEASRDVTGQILQFNAQNPLLHVQPNLVVLGVGLASGVLAMGAGVFQGRSERNYQKLINGERTQIPGIADNYFNNYIRRQSRVEKVVDGIAGRIKRKRK